MFAFRTSGSTYIHSITTSRLFTGMSFSKCPEESVGQGVLAEVGKDFVIDFESSEVGWGWMSVHMLHFGSKTYEKQQLPPPRKPRLGWPRNW